MSSTKILFKVLLINALVLICSHESIAGTFKSLYLLSITIIPLKLNDFTGTISIASAGNTGAIASAGDDEDSLAMSGVPVVQPQLSGSSNSGSGSSTSLLSRSGGSGSGQKSQSVLVGSNGNGDTTILQQSGNQPAKVYKISGSG